MSPGRTGDTADNQEGATDRTKTSEEDQGRAVDHGSPAAGASVIETWAVDYIRKAVSESPRNNVKQSPAEPIDGRTPRGITALAKGDGGVWAALKGNLPPEGQTHALNKKG